MSASGGAATSFRVSEDLAGERLDRALSHHLALPRNRVLRWISAGLVQLDGRTASKGGELLRSGVRVSWTPPPDPTSDLEPETGELRILMQDAEFVVLDKPPDMVVHPGAGRERGTLANRILSHFPSTAGIGGPGRPGIVHRLDKGTSGALLVALGADSYQFLSRCFAERQVRKTYLGIVWGSPAETSGRIDAPVGRHPVDRKRMAIRKAGRPARTTWKVRAAGEDVSLLEFGLETGRTHQIRVHARSLGHPLIGDPTYGEPRYRGRKGPAMRALADFPRPALHAWRIAFPHPRDGHLVEVEAPVPADLRGLWREAVGNPFPAL